MTAAGVVAWRSVVGRVGTWWFTPAPAARVAWLPRERRGDRRARWSDLLLMTNPRRPRARAQERIVRREPDRYRVVVADSHDWRDGRFVEILGHYDPRRDPAVVKINIERASYWISKGAQPSDTVRSLIKRQKKEAPAVA